MKLESVLSMQRFEIVYRNAHAMYKEEKRVLMMLKVRCRKTKVYAKGSETPALAALPMQGYLLSDSSAAERAL